MSKQTTSNIAIRAKSNFKDPAANKITTRSDTKELRV